MEENKEPSLAESKTKEEEEKIVKKPKRAIKPWGSGENFVRINMKRGYKPARSAAWNFKL